MDTQRSNAIASIVVLVAILSLSSLACAFSLFDIPDLMSPPPPGELWSYEPATRHLPAVPPDTREYLNPPAGSFGEAPAAPQAAPQAELPKMHPPSILSIEFPKSIPATGTYVMGKINCSDAGHDINLVHFETTRGSSASDSWDPGSKLTWAGDSCTIVFETGCGGAPQHVEADVTLRDAAGNQSTPGFLFFECR